MAPNNKLKKILMVLGIICLGIIGINSSNHYIQAANNETNSAGFTISPIIPDFQTEKNLGYYDITYQPGNKYELRLRLNNLNQTAPKTLKTTIIPATTTSDGKINYADPNQKKISGLKMLLPDLADKKTLTTVLKPGESKEIKITFKVPKKAKGEITGAFYVLRQDPKQKAKGAISINNKFAMSIPIILREKDFKKFVPKLKVQDIAIKEQNNLKSIHATILNPDPVMFGEITINSQIKNNDQSKTIIKNTVEDYEWAPKSILDLPIPLDDKELDPGTYWYIAQVKSGSKTINLKKQFEIAGPSTGKFIVESNKTIWYIIAVIILIIVIGYVFYRIGAKKSQK